MKAGAGGGRSVRMDGNAGIFTIAPGGVIRTAAGARQPRRDRQQRRLRRGDDAAQPGAHQQPGSGHRITLNPTSLTNTGTLAASNGGTLDIVTDSTLAGLGTLSNTGGTINLRGNINNQGAMLPPSVPPARSPSWAVASLAAAASRIPSGALLVPSLAPFDGVTINGDLDLSLGEAARRRSPGGRLLTRRIWPVLGLRLGFAPGQTLTGRSSLKAGQRRRARGQDGWQCGHLHHRAGRSDPHRGGLGSLPRSATMAPSAGR